MRLVLILPFILSCSLAHGKLEQCQSGIQKTGVCSLTNDYDNLSVPEKPTPIGLTVDILEVIAIDEKKQTIKLLVQFFMNWIDARLSSTNMNDSADSAINVVHLLHDIWAPEAYFSNAIEIRKLKGIKDDSLKSLYITRNTNHALVDTFFGERYRNRTFLILTDTITTEFTCKMNFEDYPFDQQQCRMVVQLTNEFQEAFFESVLFFFKDKVVEKESSLVNTSGLPFEVKARAMEPEGLEIYSWKNSKARIEINLRRKQERLNTLIISYYVPSAAFTVLSQFSFFIKPEIVSIMVQF